MSNQFKPIRTKRPSFKQIVDMAKTSYPHSAYMRRQYVKKTLILWDEGKHGLLTGGFKV